MKTGFSLAKYILDLALAVTWWDVSTTVFNCWQTSVPKNWR